MVRSMDPNVIAAAVEAWNLIDVVSVETIVHAESVVILKTSGGDEFALKITPPRQDWDRQRALLLWLRNSEDLPVPVPMPSRSGFPFAEIDGKHATLCQRLAGDIIHDHYGSDRLGRAKEFGRAIGRLDAALAKWQWDELPDTTELYSQINGRVVPAILDSGELFDQKRLRTVLPVFLDELSRLAPALPEQWIHRDTHGDNFLFDDGRVSGILDFDLLQRSNRIIDPCYCSTSILITDWATSDNRQRWPEIFREIISGYRENVELTDSERAALFHTLCSIELIFMAFSSSHGWTDAARMNEDVFFWLCDYRREIESAIA